jgi:hypothetical protein
MGENIGQVQYLGVNGIGYMELPQLDECGKISTKSGCDNADGCRWTDLDLLDMNFCKKKSEPGMEHLRKVLKSELDKKDDVLGYFPGVDALKRLATQDLTAMNPEDKKYIEQNLRLAREARDLIVGAFWANPEWADTDFEDGGGCVVLTERIMNESGAIEMRDTKLQPGDVVIVSSSAVPSMFGIKNTHWGIFVGAIPVMGTMRSYIIDVGGDGPESIRDYIACITGSSLLFTGVPGVIKFVAESEFMHERELVEKWVPTIPLRPRMSAVALAFASIGIWTYKLMHSNCQHFASYVATGRWSSKDNDSLNRNSYNMFFRPRQYTGTRTKTELALGYLHMNIRMGEYVSEKAVAAWDAIFTKERVALPESYKKKIKYTEACEANMSTIQGIIKYMSEAEQAVIRGYMDMGRLALELQARSNTIAAKWSSPDAIRKASRMGGALSEDWVFRVINSDLEDLATRYAQLKDNIAADSETIKRYLTNYVIVSCTGRSFIWSRYSLAVELEKQTADGQPPHDPVTHGLISRESYRIVTAKDVPENVRRSLEKATVQLHVPTLKRSRFSPF